MRLPSEEVAADLGGEALGRRPGSPPTDPSLNKLWALRPKPGAPTPAPGGRGLLGKGWEMEAACGKGMGRQNFGCSCWWRWGGGVGAWGRLALFQVSPLFFSSEQSPCLFEIG